MLATDPDSESSVSSCEACGRPLVSEANRCPDCADAAARPPLGYV